MDSTEISYGMAGRLYCSDSGWILLSVPNALVRGAFAALQEPGVELPPSGPNGGLNAHISVIRPEELETIGGPAVITERGKTFRYTTAEIRTVRPHGWEEMERVWFMKVRSPALEKLRKSYGLSPKPKNNEFDFHITVAVRKRRVLQNNGVVVDRADGGKTMDRQTMGEIIRNTANDGKSRTVKVAIAPFADLADSSKHSIVDSVLGRNSYIGKGLKRWQPQWDSSAGIGDNVMSNLSRIQAQAQKQLRQELNGQQYLASLDPNYAATHTIDYLRNGRQPFQSAVDEIAYQVGLLRGSM